MALELEVVIAGSSAPAGHYFTWAPVPCTIRVTDADGAETPVPVVVGSSGAIQFRTASGDAVADELRLELDPAGAPTEFDLVPLFGAASANDGDVTVKVTAADGTVVVEQTAMIRIRKNANDLTSAERDRFVAAFATLNDSGAGVFQDFRDMHVDMTSNEAHGRAAFLSWHRAYLLDLERELQAVNPAVVLPYWRFDEPAPNVFTPDFMGSSTSTLETSVAPTNPLSTWVTDGQPGISRRARFAEKTDPAPGLPGFPVLTEVETLQLGLDFVGFNDMEASPHGAAHVSFDGFIRSIGTAARDPLFFLLHCNVDRLWAKWQWIRDRFDLSDPQTYPPADVPEETDQLGHRLTDTMWPWNGDINPPRPPTAPRTPLATSPVTPAPGPNPTVADMIDYHGQLNRAGWLAFGYDDVPYDG
jgi:tyrosinase